MAQTSVPSVGPESELLDENRTICSLNFVKSGHQKLVGAAIKRRLNRTSLEDDILWSYELYDFIDNDRYTNLDYFLNQLGSSTLILSEDVPESSDGKKILTVIQEYSPPVVYCKRSFFRSVGSAEIVEKLIREKNYASNSVEVCPPPPPALLFTPLLQIERPLGLCCLMCLNQHLQLSLSDDCAGHGIVTFGSLSQYMRLDSAAANAINLFPKADDPSPYGSLYGLLNRCKTKMGQRLLERFLFLFLLSLSHRLDLSSAFNSWLRHPLLDVNEINRRLDIVEMLTSSVLGRNRLVDGALKGIPDLDHLLSKSVLSSLSLSVSLLSLDLTEASS
jgi:DNA mismatch repair protein MSH2